MSTLVLGCGSIGRRHIRNLRLLEITDLIAYDPDPRALAAVKDEYGVACCQSIEEGLAREPATALVCTPPNLHVSVASACVAAGCHVFIEKPLAHRLDGVDNLLADAVDQQRIVYVGYNWRFHPGLRRIKQLLQDGAVGRPLNIRAEFGQYLPDWRPTEDYRRSYTATAAVGGGIILDASHELDYVQWLGGEVESVFCIAAQLSDLEMDAVDTAEIALRMREDLIAQLHLDCVQRAYSRSCKIVGEAGTLTWDHAVGIRHFQVNDKSWREEPFRIDPNAMYVDEMAHFLACSRGEAAPLVDGEIGKRVLILALAAMESAQTRKEVMV